MQTTTNEPFAGQTGQQQQQQNPTQNHQQPTNSSDMLVANLTQISLEELVKSKLEILFRQQKETRVELSGLYSLVMEQVEKPLIELSLRAYNGNQVRTAQMLGINRNTLKKKIDHYGIKPRRLRLN